MHVDNKLVEVAEEPVEVGIGTFAGLQEFLDVLLKIFLGDLEEQGLALLRKVLLPAVVAITEKLWRRLSLQGLLKRGPLATPQTEDTLHIVLVDGLDLLSESLLVGFFDPEEPQNFPCLVFEVLLDLHPDSQENCLDNIQEDVRVFQEIDEHVRQLVLHHALPFPLEFGGEHK